ncbi:MAG: hypothetical protein JWP89_1061 [Schlesneria sp.]|nr:hypothetical protein [Schlesneria sp.]
MLICRSAARSSCVPELCAIVEPCACSLFCAQYVRLECAQTAVVSFACAPLISSNHLHHQDAFGIIRHPKDWLC